MLFKSFVGSQKFACNLKGLEKSNPHPWIHFSSHTWRKKNVRVIIAKGTTDQGIDCFNQFAYSAYCTCVAYSTFLHILHFCIFCIPCLFCKFCIPCIFCIFCIKVRLSILVIKCQFKKISTSFNKLASE